VRRIRNLSHRVPIGPRIIPVGPHSSADHNKILFFRDGSIRDWTAILQRHMKWTVQRSSAQSSIPTGTRGDKNASQDRRARPARPEKRFPQTNALDLMAYREVSIWTTPCLSSARAASPQPHDQWRRGGVACADLLQTSTVEGLKFFNDEYLEIMDRYPASSHRRPTHTHSKRPVGPWLRR